MTAASLRRGRRAVIPPETWVRDEPALLDTALSEIRRLLRRASKRWRVALAATLLVVAFVTVKVATKQPEYNAEVVLRMVEGAEHGPPMSSDQLRDYVWEVVFSGRHLLDVIKRFNLNPRWADKDPSYAVDDFRDAISMTIWQSDTISGAESRRSARLTIGYRTGVRTLAQPVVQALSDLLAETEENRRRAALSAQVASSKNAVDRAAALANLLREEANAAEAASPGLVAKARVASEDRLRREQSAAVSTELRLKAISEGQALRFEQVDAGREPPEQTSEASTIIRAGLLTAALAFPLVLLLIGAFDPYVVIGEDVGRVGIPLLGIVPGSAAPRPQVGEPDKPSV